MICPNCDGILNVIGCQNCGWKMGDPFPAHRFEFGNAHPFKQGDGLYPPNTAAAPVAVPIVREDPGFHPKVRVVVSVPEPVPSESPIAEDPGARMPDAHLFENCALAPTALQSNDPAVEIVVPPAEPEAPASIAEPLTKSIQ